MADAREQLEALAAGIGELHRRILGAVESWGLHAEATALLARQALALSRAAAERPDLSPWVSALPPDLPVLARLLRDRLAEPERRELVRLLTEGG